MTPGKFTKLNMNQRDDFLQFFFKIKQEGKALDVIRDRYGLKYEQFKSVGEEFECKVS